MKALIRISTRIFLTLFLFIRFRPIKSSSDSRSLKSFSSYPRGSEFERRWPEDNDGYDYSGLNLASKNSSNPQTNFICRPTGPCQPCPIEELSSTVCQVYQNRRSVECLYLDQSPNLSRREEQGNKKDDSTSSSSSSENPSNLKSESDNPNNNVYQDDNRQGREGVGVNGEDGNSDLPSWEACERVVSKERKDFFEFVVCNFMIASVSLIVFGFRTKQLVIRQYGKLASRIGILPL